MCRPLICCLCFGDTRIPFKHNVGKPGSSPCAKNELDRLCHFDRTSTCDRRTDRHTDTWAVALSCPGARPFCDKTLLTTDLTCPPLE